MNHEENRLNTFTNWPTSAAVEPIRIAKAGFYYTGQGLEVQCFSCDGKISEWNYGDQVMALHRTLFPDCPFVENPQNSGNVALVLSQRRSSGSPTSIDCRTGSIPVENNYSFTEEDEMYRNDALRLLSFVNWPTNFITREPLVSAGFYHMGGGSVRCAWCGGELSRMWVPGDDPLDEHIRHFPHCEYASQLVAAQTEPPTFQFQPHTPPSQSPLSTTPPTQFPFSPPQTDVAVHNSRVLSRATTWRSLGVVCGTQGAVHPDRASLAARLATFTRWPEDHSQAPQALADAGFYYMGREDRVRCFYCDGGLGMWETGDTPWTEHARWFPECGYVLLVKGKKFIEKCKNNKGGNPTLSVDPSVYPMHRVLQEGQETLPVSEFRIEEQMDSPLAMAALGAGLDAARVRRAITRRLRTTGIPFTTPESLIDAVLDEHLNEEPWSASPQNQNMTLARDILAESYRGYPSSLLLPTATASDESQPSGANRQTDTDTVGEEYEEPGTSGNKELTLEEENRQLKEARLCKVCMDKEVSVVFLPCGHLVSCAECGSSLEACPLCRASVRALVRAYLA